MKNRFFSFLLVLSVGFVGANDDAADFAVALARIGTEAYVANKTHQDSLPTQKNLLKRLRWMFEHNPMFYKLDEFQKNIDYYVAILADHIKTLDGKIALNENGLKSSGMRVGLTTTGLSALCGYASYYFFNERSALLAAKNTPKALDYMIASVSFGLMSTVFAAVAGNKFYKVSRYAQRIIERLERDKKFLAILEQEKVELDGRKANDTTEKVNNALNAVVAAITHAIQGTATSTPVPCPAAPMIEPFAEPAEEIAAV